MSLLFCFWQEVIRTTEFLTNRSTIIRIIIQKNKRVDNFILYTFAVEGVRP